MPNNRPVKAFDLENIKKKDCPMIVFCRDRKNLISRLISNFTHGHNHVMELWSPQYFASQNFNGYSRVAINKYNKKHIHLMFYKPKLSIKDRKLWLQEISKAIKAIENKPWYHRIINRQGYDYLGILGQLIGIDQINNPWKEYCSEDVTGKIRRRMKLNPVQAKPNPQELFVFVDGHPDFEYMGELNPPAKT